MNARLNLVVASPGNEAAGLDQLDGDIFGSLMGKDGVAIQDLFLEDDWASLVLDDVMRFARTEKMTETSFSPQQVTYMCNKCTYVRLHSIVFSELQVSAAVKVEELDDNSNSNNSVPNDLCGTDKVRMAWVEPKDIQSMYPALAEAIHNMHSLPFEINGEAFLSFKQLHC